jgi:hypothetical protein
MNSAMVTTRVMHGGIVNYNVRWYGLCANGTAELGSRPTRWTVSLGRSRYYRGATAGDVRTMFRLRGRAFAAVLKAVETGRI